MNAEELLDTAHDIDWSDDEVTTEWEELYPREDEPEVTTLYLHEVLWTDERDALDGVDELPLAA